MKGILNTDNNRVVKAQEMFSSYEDKDKAKESNIKFLYKVLSLIQNLQSTLNGTSTEQIQITTEYNKTLTELAKVNREKSVKAADKMVKDIEKREKASFWKKLFGGIAEALGMIVGGLLTITGAGAGAGITMMSASIMGIINTFEPEAFEKLVTSMCAKCSDGDKEKAKLATKIAMLIIATVAGAAAGGGAGGLSMFGSMFGSANPVTSATALYYQDKKGYGVSEAEEKARSNKVANAITIGITVAALILSLGKGLSDVANASKNIANGAEKATKMGKMIKKLKALVKSPAFKKALFGTQTTMELANTAAGLSISIVGMELAGHKYDSEVSKIDSEQVKKMIKQLEMLINVISQEIAKDSSTVVGMVDKIIDIFKNKATEAANIAQ